MVYAKASPMHHRRLYQRSAKLPMLNATSEGCQSMKSMFFRGKGVKEVTGVKLFRDGRVGASLADALLSN